ncbi:hypothetical protein AGMMS49592_1130 [Endomicrobiia bacterium]|nr:hypothetical protein AGMMS49592_1130 [Endomicrobiia bacterium]
MAKTGKSRMKTKTVKAILSVFVAFSLALSSCDKKSSFIVNRRTATPERVEKIKEVKEQRQARDASPFIQMLRTMGRPDDEIKGFVKLEKENEYLESPLGEIVHIASHFVY